MGSGVAHDSAGNPNTIAASSVSRTYDITSPTVTLSTVATNPTSSAFVVTATFSEAVTGLTSSDFGLTNGTISGFSGGPIVYTFTLTPVGQGLVQLDLAANECQDGASNQNIAATALSRTYDSVAPTLTLSTSATNPTNAAFTVTATFSESVSGFLNTDVSVTNGSISNFSGGPSIYTFDVTPTTDGLVTVSVGAGVAQDGVGLSNLGATDLTRNYDSTMPSVTLTTAAPDPTNGAFSVTAAFSEDVAGFLVTDIVSPKATISNFSGGPSVYTFDVNPLEDGLITVDIPTSSCTDLGGSPNIAGSLNRTVDTGNPTITIATPTLDITDVSPIPFAILFSEDVAGFTVGDIDVTNGTISNFISEGTVFRFDVTPGSAGAVTVSVDAGAAQDLVGNLTPSASLTIMYDPVVLTATVSSATPAIFNSGNMTVTVNFNTNTTLVASDLSLINATVANISGGGTSYTVELTPVGQGQVGLEVAKVKDRPAIQRLYDSTPPTTPSGLSLSDVNWTNFKTPNVNFVESTDAGTGVAQYEARVFNEYGDVVESGPITKGGQLNKTFRGNISYYMQIRAQDNAGNWSAWSASSGEWTVNRRVMSGSWVSDSPCLIQINGKLRCWGLNTNGRLGIGTTDNRGDGPVGEMAVLPEVELGAGRTVKKVSGGFLFACAILDNDKVKCWGSNLEGQLGLGLGTGDHRGDAANEMGDNLPYVDLGVGRTAKQIGAGFRHACAVLDDNTLKCWGQNAYGQLGIGSATNQTTPQLVSNLGTGLTIKKLSVSGQSTCLLFTNNKIKCFGFGSMGEIGLGTSNNIGDSAAEMGDNLAFVDLGTGRTVKDLFGSSGTNCAILDNNTMKCWGRNTGGELGTGDTTSRGTSSSHMGDNLGVTPWGTGLTPKFGALNVNGNCAVFTDGRMKCFGDYPRIQTTSQRYLLGNLSDNNPFIDFGGRTVVDVLGVADAACVTLSDESIICFGRSGAQGRLGQDSSTLIIGDDELVTTFVPPLWFYQTVVVLSPSNPQVGINTATTFAASGGFAPYTYSIISGGGSINSSTGEYTAPGAAGSATIQVQDSQGNIATTTATITNCIAGSSAFSYTGSSQTFTMPAGCTKATIKAWGGGGAGGLQWGSYGNNGGGGGYATGVVNLAPGENLTVNVGGGGVFAGGGGWNGGAGAGPYQSDPISGTSPRAGGGGGATDVRRVGTNLTDRILVAGGGGGGGSCYKMYNNACVGGPGGGTAGASGTMFNGTVTFKIGFGTATATVSGYGGGGGSGLGGGVGGYCTTCYGNSGSAGSLGGGGAPYSAPSIMPGGGGGGGYYGGGGGAAWSGGGGGSSYFGGMSSGSSVMGSGSVPGNSTDPDRSGAGSGGGIAGSGSAGRVVIYYE